MRAHVALRLQILLALGCVGDKKRSSACFDRDSDDPACPDADEVDPTDLFPVDCGSTVLAVLSGPYPGNCSFGDSATALPNDDCFYDVRVIDTGNCGYGRPYACAAAPVAREDWAAPLRPRLDGVDRAARTATWTAIALDEHASIASFAALILDMLANGAPAALVMEAQRALADEVRHTTLAFGLASAYAGQAIGPGALRGPAREPADRVAMAVACAYEGCVAETRAAAGLAERAQQEWDPVVAGVLRTLSQDEARHAILAWRLLRWLMQAGGEPVREAAATALRSVKRDETWTELIAPVAATIGVWEQEITEYT